MHDIPVKRIDERRAGLHQEFIIEKYDKSSKKVVNAVIDVSDAGSRTLSQVADEVAADANPDIPVRRTSLMVSGLEAIMLDEIYTYDVLRKVVILQDDRVYTLTFVSWSDAQEDLPRLENLYNMVNNSLTFLPRQAGLTPTPDLSSSTTVRTVSSTSPDGKWTAEALLAIFAGDTEAFDYARLTITQDFEDSLRWMPYEEWSEGGLGDSFISDFYWSADGRYLYFTHTGFSEPCGYPFTTNLHRVDLRDGNLSEIPLTHMSFGEIAISLGVRRMAYRTAEGVLVYDLENGGSRTLPYS